MPDPPPALRRELGLRDLVLFNIAAVVSLRWLATAAHIGPGSALLWAGAALFFFVPLARAVAKLAGHSPQEGGIYVWTRECFGERHGFFCGWCYWLSNLFYFPNLLVAGVGMALHAFEPQIAAEDRVLVVSISLLVLWIAVLTNLVGLRVGKWTQNLGAAATCATGAAIIAAGGAALARFGPAAPYDLFEGWNRDRLNFWPQIAFAFGGLELGTILGGEIRDPERNLRRAAWTSALAIAAIYTLGTLAVLALLRPEQVSVVTGLAQAGAAAGAKFQLAWLAPALALLIVAGLAGQFGAWMSGAARLAFVVGLDRYLPASFGRLHPRWRTPHIALAAQGLGCTAVLVAMQAGENLRTAYQLLVDMTVITYFVPFLYLFAAAWRAGLRLAALSGAAVTALGIVFSFVPPAGAGSIWLFEAKLAAGCAAVFGAGQYFFARGRSLARG